MSGFFYNLGRQLGRKAIPAARRSKWIWDGLTGDEEEALRARGALGAEMAAEMRQVAMPVHDPASSALMAELCERLAARLRNKKITFRCEILHDPCPSAVALPGGYLFLTDGLLAFCDNHPDELAFVLGHEMAHVLRGHAWDRMVNDTALRFASALSLRAGQLGAWFRGKGLDLLRSAYTREAEFEADEFAYRLVGAAGFNTAGALDFLERSGREQTRGSDCGPYFASHPQANQRIARLSKI